VRAVGELDVDHVGRADEAAHEHDPHDAGLADEVAVRVTVEDGTHEAVLVAVDLRARVAQAGQLDDGVVAEVEPGADGQAEQVDAAGRDVLAEVARCHGEPATRELVEQLGLHEVDLPEVRRRVRLASRPVLNCRAGVHVALDADPGREPHHVRVDFGEPVHSTPAHRHHRPI
jgi:hypothetical protein